MEKITLTESQRVDATAYIFTAFELEIKKKDTKIKEDDDQYTLTGTIDGDADAMYIVLEKHELTKELDITLAQIKVLDYFKKVYQNYLDNISNRCLILCKSTGNKSKDKSEVVELLIQDVFKKIPIYNFSSTCNSLSLNISSLSQGEKDVFEEALEIFLRQHFGVPKSKNIEIQI